MATSIPRRWVDALRDIEAGRSIQRSTHGALRRRGLIHRQAGRDELTTAGKDLLRAEAERP
jgi:ribosomal protein S19E (S16A)